MTPPSKPRTPKLALIAGVLSALLIGGVLAQATNIFSFGSNVAETGQIGPDGEAAIQIALTELDAPDCEFLDNYTDGPLAGVFSAGADDFDLESSQDQVLTDQYICIRNAGTETANLTFQFTIQSNDDFACSPNEEEWFGSPDSDCGTGEGAGELDTAISREVSNVFDSNPEACPGGTYVEFVSQPSVIDVGPMGDGLACKYRIRTIFTPAIANSNLGNMQTDRLIFSLLAGLETP